MSSAGRIIYGANHLWTFRPTSMGRNVYGRVAHGRTGRNDHGTKRPHMRRNVHGANCQWVEKPWHLRVIISSILLWLQTYLEQTKTKFSKDYKAMNPAKITTTVGLNSRYSVVDLTVLTLDFCHFAFSTFHLATFVTDAVCVCAWLLSNDMTFYLGIWHRGSRWHYLGQGHRS